MADDIQLQVGLDLDALKVSAERGAEVLGKAFQNAMGSILSGATLGSGMPPTGVAPGAGPHDAIVDALEDIQHLLASGFQMLASNAGAFGTSGAGGAGAAGRPGQPAPGPFTPMGPAPGPRNPEDGSKPFNWRGVLGAVDRFPMQSFANMYSGGFYNTDMARFGADLLSGVPIIGKLAGVFSNAYEMKDQFLSQSMDIFRKGGEESRLGFRAYTQTDDRRGLMEDYGIDRNGVARLFGGAASYGSTDILRLAQLEGKFGMAGEGIALNQALTKGGVHLSGMNEEGQTFANILATAIATNLDRGRWGEAFSMMTKAAQRISTGDVDVQGTLAMMNFIGQEGGRFRGDTQASASMVGMLQGLQGGQGGGFANIMALQAAGLGQGASYQDAWMRVQTGAALGGVDLATLLKRYANHPAVKRYMESGSEADLTRATFLLAPLLPGHKPTDIRAMLSMMRKGMPDTPSDRLRELMFDQLTNKNMPSDEQDLERRNVEKSWTGTSIGSNELSRTPGLVENQEQARMWGGFRTGADVVTTTDNSPIAGVGMEGYGDKREFWPDPNAPGGDGVKAGWRRLPKGQEKRHLARDIAMPPGERIYSPVDGVWMTNRPQMSNPRSIKEGLVGELLGDNGILYRFIHVGEFNSALKRGYRVTQGMYIGTVAAGSGGNWKPHIHLEAHRNGRRSGDSNAVDPLSTFDASANEVMRGMRAAEPSGSPAPVFVEPDPNNPGQFRPTADGLPAKETPITQPSQTSQVDVRIFVHDSRVAVKRTTRRGGAPGQLFNSKKVG